MIGIIGAMPVEMEKIAGEIQNKKEKTISGIKFIKGFIGKTEVVTAVCGVGKVFAAVCAQTMILKYRPEMIINTGVAGGISKELKIGDIVIAADVVQHDMDTTALGDPAGMISGLNIIKIPADKHLADKMACSVKAVGKRPLLGTIVSGDQFINDNAKKEHLRKTFSAAACEMEGGAIGQVCHINKTPFVVIRAVSDTADEDSGSDFISFAEMAAENSANVIKHFIGEHEKYSG